MVHEFENPIHVSERLPECGKKVIAFYTNEWGRKRTIMAYHADKNAIEASDEDEFYEYNEQDDKYYLPEGWYENNEFDEVDYFISADITHWMPLPLHPGKAGG